MARQVFEYKIASGSSAGYWYYYLTNNTATLVAYSVQKFNPDTTANITVTKVVVPSSLSIKIEGTASTKKYPVTTLIDTFCLNTVSHGTSNDFYFIYNNIRYDICRIQRPNVQSIVLPNTITTIGKHAFNRQSALTQITISANYTDTIALTTIGNEALQGCGTQFITTRAGFINSEFTQFPTLVLNSTGNIYTVLNPCVSMAEAVFTELYQSNLNPIITSNAKIFGQPLKNLVGKAWGLVSVKSLSDIGEHCYVGWVTDNNSLAHPIEEVGSMAFKAVGSKVKSIQLNWSDARINISRSNSIIPSRYQSTFNLLGLRNPEEDFREALSATVSLSPPIPTANNTNRTTRGYWTVRLIAKNAFYGCTALKSLFLPGNPIRTCDDYIYSSQKDTHIHIGEFFGTKAFAGAIPIATVSTHDHKTPITYYLPKNLFKVEFRQDDVRVSCRDCTNLNQISMQEACEVFPTDFAANCSELRILTLSGDLHTVFSPSDFIGLNHLYYIDSYAPTVEQSNYTRPVNGILYQFKGTVSELGGSATLVKCPAMLATHDGYLSTPPSPGYELGDWCFARYVGSEATVVNTSYLTHLEPRTLTILSHAFDGCANLQIIDLFYSATTFIEPEAFINCSNLKTLVVSGTGYANKSTSIGPISRSIIRDCPKLELTLFEGVAYLGHYNNPYVVAYETDTTTNLSTISIHSDTYKIADSAFLNNLNLTHISIPQSVDYIGSYAFSGCSNLTTVKNDAVVGRKFIHAGTYAGCSSLTLPNADTDKATNLLNYAINIEQNAFSSCTSLKIIKVGYQDDDTTSIYDNAFSGCTAVTSLDIGPGVDYIGSYAFSGCTKLYLINCNCQKDLQIGDKIFNKSGAKVGVDVSVGESCQYLPANLFNRDKTGMSADLLTVGFDQNCPCTSISEGCFKNSGIKSLYLNNNITKLETDCLAQCSQLETIEFGLNMNYTEYNKGILKDCINLNRVVFQKSPESGFYSLFFDDTLNKSNEAIPLKPGSLNLVLLQETIYESVFANCLCLKSLVLGGDITKIGQHAFENCSNLELVRYTCKEVEDCTQATEAFCGCGNSEKLFTLHIDLYYVERIPSYLFYSGEADKQVYLGEIVLDGPPYNSTPDNDYKHKQIDIGDYAFYNCVFVSDLTWLRGAHNIGDYAFINWGASEINKNSTLKLMFSDKIEKIGKYCFSHQTPTGHVFPQHDLYILNLPSWCTNVSIETDDIDQSQSVFYNADHVYVWDQPIENLPDNWPEGYDLCTNSFDLNLYSDTQLSEIKPGALAFLTAPNLTITLNESCTTIGEQSFAHTTLKTLNIPVSNKKIFKKDAFIFSLIERIIIDNVANWCTMYFDSMFANPLTSNEPDLYITVEDELKKITTLTEDLFLDANGQSILVIPQYAFAGNTFDKILIPAAVKSIGKGAFCTFVDSLKELAIPFLGHFSKDTNILFKEENILGNLFSPKTDIVESYVKDRMKVTTQYKLTSLVFLQLDPVYYYIPKALNKITIYSGNLGYCALSGCSQIKEIVKLNNLDDFTYVCGYAFYKCGLLDNNQTIYPTIKFGVSRSSAETWDSNWDTTEVSSQEVIDIIPESNILWDYSVSFTDNTFEYKILSESTELSEPTVAVVSPIQLDLELYEVPAQVIDQNSSKQYTITQIADIAFTLVTSSSYKVKFAENNYINDIGNGAFKNTNLQSIDFAQAPLTHIGQEAFAGTLLQEIKLNSTTVNSSEVLLDNNTFSSCTLLQSADLSLVNILPNSIFSNCYSLENVELSANLRRIHANAFNNCTALSVLTLPSSLYYIEDSNAFYNCGLLKTINYTGSLKDWCDPPNTALFSANEQSLYDEDKDKDLVGWRGNPLINGANLYCYDDNMQLTLVENLEINNTFSYIRELAFSNCSSLQTVSIRSFEGSIKSQVFAQDNLTKVEISIDSKIIHNTDTVLFEDCKIDTAIIPINWLNIFDRGLTGELKYLSILATEQPNLTLDLDITFSGIKALTIDASLTESWLQTKGVDYTQVNIFSETAPETFEGPAFWLTLFKKHELTSIKIYIEDSIPDNLLYDLEYPATKLEYISIDAIDKTRDISASIGARAFYGCCNLKSFKWGRALGGDNLTGHDIIFTKIGADAFADWPAFDSTDIDLYTTELGPDNSNAYYCAYYLGDFDSNLSYILLKVLDIKPVEELPENFEATFTLLHSTSALYQNAFDGCMTITDVQAEKTNIYLTELPIKCFNACANLRTVDLTAIEKLTSIEDACFSDCVNLEKILGCEYLEHFGETALENCPKYQYSSKEGLLYLTQDYTVLIGYIENSNNKVLSSTRVIYKNAFSGFKGALTFEKASNITELHTKAFYNASGIVSIDFSSAELSKIPNNCFARCDHLERIELPNTIKYIGRNAFKNTYALKEIFFGKGSLSDLELWCNINFENKYSNPLYYDLPKYGMSKVNNKNEIKLCDEIFYYPKTFNLNTLIQSSILDISQYNIKQIPDCTFIKNTNLQCVILPQAIRSIGEYAFADNTSLKYIDAFDPIMLEEEKKEFKRNILNISKPDSLYDMLHTFNNLIYIGRSAFENCDLLGFKSSNNQLVINDYAFKNCSDLRVIELATLKLDDFVFDNACNYISDTDGENGSIVKVPASVLGHLNVQSFYNLSIFDDGSSLNPKLFQQAQHLTNLEFIDRQIDSKLLYKLSPEMFSQCLALATITDLNSKDTKYIIEKHCIIYKEKEDTEGTLIFGANNAQPNKINTISITSVKDHAFLNRTLLNDFSLPSTIKNIGLNIFKGAGRSNQIGN